MMRDDCGQVSFEYLLTVIFAIILVIVVSVFALNFRSVANSAQTRISSLEENYFMKVFG